MDDVVFLIGLPFEELSWEYAEPKEKNQDCMPCIFIQFKSRENSRETKMLQVFTKEAALIDAIIEASIALKKKSASKGEDTIDGNRVTFGSEEDWQNFNRLCLTTFNEKGEMLNSSIRSKKS